MKRFVIEISDEHSSQLDQEDRSNLITREYLNLIRCFKKANLCDDIKKDISVICDRCESFILPTRTLYFAMENDFFYGIDFKYEVEDKIMKVVYLSNEEWIKYLVEGSKDIDFIYHDNGTLITDSEGHPYRFLWEECAIIFNSKCGCNTVMCGTSEETSI
jgi:hypothetical protein